MVPMVLTNCGNLLELTGRFSGRDLVTLCLGKVRRGPIRDVVEDERAVLMQCLWVAEMGSDGEWFVVPSVVAIDAFKNQLAMWRGDELHLFTNGYTFMAIMPEGDNLDPSLVQGLVGKTVAV